jgi:hypothetical protein
MAIYGISALAFLDMLAQSQKWCQFKGNLMMKDGVGAASVYEFMAEGMGFEPMTPISRSNRLAGGRTRPLCDPSSGNLGQYSTVFLYLSTK